MKALTDPLYSRHYNSGHDDTYASTYTGEGRGEELDSLLTRWIL